MGIPLTNNGRLNIHHRIFARTLLHFVNCHCDSVWNLSIQCVERLLTDHLCHNLALGLVRYGILIIEHGSIRKIFQNTVNNILCILSAECRARDNLGKITDLAVRINCRKNLLFFHCIDLINDQNDRHANALELLCNVTLTSSDEGRRLNQPHNCIHLF